MQNLPACNQFDDRTAHAGTSTFGKKCNEITRCHAYERFFRAPKKSKQICRNSDGREFCLHVINSSLHTIILLVRFELHAGRLSKRLAAVDNNSDTSIWNFDTVFSQLHTSIWSWQQLLTIIVVKHRFDNNYCQAPFFLYFLSWLYREMFRTPKNRFPLRRP